NAGVLGHVTLGDLKIARDRRALLFSQRGPTGSLPLFKHAPKKRYESRITFRRHRLFAIRETLIRQVFAGALVRDERRLRERFPIDAVAHDVIIMPMGSYNDAHGLIRYLA